MTAVPYKVHVVVDRQFGERRTTPACGRRLDRKEDRPSGENPGGLTGAAPLDAS
jgi:hypothetical protein